MEVTTIIQNDALIIRLEGEVLDAGNSAEFKEKIQPLLHNRSQVAFDFGKVRFIDSSGCGALISCLRKVNADDGKMVFFNVNRQVQTLFELIRMHKIIEIHETREDALAGLNA